MNAVPPAFPTSETPAGESEPAAETAKPFLDELFAEGVLIPSGVDGLYGRSGAFEDVIDRFEVLIERLAHEDGAVKIHFPPAMPRVNMEKSGYLKSFPQLAGSIHSFVGGDADHCRLLAAIAEGADWSTFQQATDLVLTPAACYPLYPTVAAKGAVPEKGLLFDLKSYCFRHEPSKEPTRMQFFRMRENVCIGSPEQVKEFRERWLERGPKLVRLLELPCTLDVANDPFFGRGGKLMARNQRDQQLKFELLIPVNSVEEPTACLSFNYHQDHFGTLWQMSRENGEVAHSACVGFGLERIALALFRQHGTDVEAWPKSVRKVLWG
ncbi:MAG: amino acid--[acyl-carrier-protein] ligase [Phyllobacteriaceae bacterium]|nr:amino acid--[acyl-carrier-protein] ligase [Phyllobacteriaceae bacterium]